MTIQAPIRFTNRTALPRALIVRRPGDESWNFAVNEIVDFGDTLAIINGCTRSAAGRRLYEIELLGNDYGRPYRVLRAEGPEAGPAVWFDGGRIAQR